MDDAVVVGENVYEHRLKSENLVTAAIDGTREVAGPVIFSILTNIVAFVPLMIIPGETGKFWKPLPIVVVSPEIGFATGLMAIAIPGALQFIMGNVLEPRIMGNLLDLHPVTILLALIFWGTIWGMSGVLMSVPITAVLRILLERLEMTAPLAALMAGRSPTDTPTAQPES